MIFSTPKVTPKWLYYIMGTHFFEKKKIYSESAAREVILLCASNFQQGPCGRRPYLHITSAAPEKE